MAFEQWRAVSITDIAFYAFALIASIYPAYNILAKKSYFKWFYVRFIILILAKLGGGCTTVVFINDINNSNGSDYNINLLIASLVLNPIATGFIIFLYVYTSHYVSKVLKNGDIQKRVKLFDILTPIRKIKENPRDFEAWDSINVKLAFIALIINAVGGGMSNGNLTVAKKLAETGSILYLIALIFTTGNTLFKLTHILGDVTVQKLTKYILSILLFISPFMITRVIYSILAAFNMNTSSYIQSASKYSFLFGDWKIYTFVAFLEECVAVLLLVIITFIVAHVNEYPLGREFDTESNSKLTNDNYTNENY